MRAADPAKARKRATTVRQSDKVTAERPPANDDRKAGDAPCRQRPTAEAERRPA
jgi:hypothetical protein